MSLNVVEPRGEGALSGTQRSPAKIEGRLVLVTGATSLLGRLVVDELLSRGLSVVLLLRPSSTETLESLSTSLDGAAWRASTWKDVKILRGDLWEPDFGLDAEGMRTLRGITEIVHLARPRASEPVLLGALVKGHDSVIDLARRLVHLRRLVVLSTTDVTGDFAGRFYEDWLDVGQPLSTQKAREAAEAETRLHEAAAHVPICIARHALLVGHSRTGQMECSEGFENILSWGAMSARLPSFVHPPGPGAGDRFVVVSPVDYVARGLVELALCEEMASAETFCLADPSPPTYSELFDLVLRRCGGPTPGIRVPVESRGPVGRSIGALLRAGSSLGTTLGGGPGVFAYLTRRGDHDTSNALRVVGGAGIECPPLETYFDSLYEGFRRRRTRSGA